MQADGLKSWDLELDDVDRRFGIVHAVAVTCGRAAVVIVEGSDGMIGVGRCVPWPEHPFEDDKAVKRARFKARGKLAKVRHIRNDVHTGRMPDRALRTRARFEAEAAE